MFSRLDCCPVGRAQAYCRALRRGLADPDRSILGECYFSWRADAIGRLPAVGCEAGRRYRGIATSETCHRAPRRPALTAFLAQPLSETSLLGHPHLRAASGTAEGWVSSARPERRGARRLPTRSPIHCVHQSLLAGVAKTANGIAGCTEGLIEGCARVLVPVAS